MANFFSPGGYPANYFGRGEDFCLPEDHAIVREYERRFQEYEAAHPEDPMGEKLLEADRKKKLNLPKAIDARLSDRTIPTEEKVEAEPPIEMDEMVEVEMTIPKSQLDLFKRYCKFQRRRPRDIFLLWIARHCKL